MQQYPYDKDYTVELFINSYYKTNLKLATVNPASTLSEEDWNQLSDQRRSQWLFDRALMLKETCVNVTVK